MNLLYLVQNDDDSDAMLELLNFFEKDMLKLSRYIQIPRENALQSMKLEMNSENPTDKRLASISHCIYFFCFFKL